jgi:hypothetical protein
MGTNLLVRNIPSKMATVFHVKLENIDQQMMHTIHVPNVPVVRSLVVIELCAYIVIFLVHARDRIFVNVAPEKNGRAMRTNASHVPSENTRQQLI